MGYYDLLADAFLKGQLHIDIRPGDMYVHDMIPFEGRYYLQWGPVPALFHMAAKLIKLTLSDRVACLLIAWLTTLVFWRIISILGRRFFPDLPRGIYPWFVMAFGLSTTVAVIGLRGTVYHESIGMAALGVMVAVLGLLRYLETPSWGWALLAGLGIGGAIGSRIPLALYGIGLGCGLLAVQYLRRHSIVKALSHLTAYCIPILVSGGLLLAYNQARFGSPWDYGDNYLVDAVEGLSAFDLGRIPENIRHYLLAPPQLTADFPWIGAQWLAARRKGGPLGRRLLALLDFSLPAARRPVLTPVAMEEGPRNQSARFHRRCCVLLGNGVLRNSLFRGGRAALRS